MRSCENLTIEDILQAWGRNWAKCRIGTEYPCITPSIPFVPVSYVPRYLDTPSDEVYLLVDEFMRWLKKRKPDYALALDHKFVARMEDNDAVRDLKYRIKFDTYRRYIMYAKHMASGFLFARGVNFKINH